MPSRDWVLPLTVGVLAVALWQGIEWVVAARFPVVPAPSSIAAALVQSWPAVRLNLGQTFAEALVGFVIGNLAGLVIAALLALVPPLEGSLYNLIVTVHSIPLLAIAPVLVLWLGVGAAPVSAIAALACFFPMAVNMTRGLKAAPPLALDLFRSLNAGWPAVFRHLLLPASLPYLVTALKMGAPAAVLGATVGEWLGTGGLGYLLFSSMVNFDVPLLWATMLVGTLLALVGFVVFALVERILLSWHSAARSAGRP